MVCVELLQSFLQTVDVHGILGQSLLLVGQVVIQPVIGNSHAVGSHGSIQQVGRMPVGIGCGAAEGLHFHPCAVQVSLVAGDAEHEGQIHNILGTLGVQTDAVGAVVGNGSGIVQQGIDGLLQLGKPCLGILVGLDELGNLLEAGVVGQQSGVAGLDGGEDLADVGGNVDGCNLGDGVDAIGDGEGHGVIAVEVGLGGVGVRGALQSQGAVGGSHCHGVGQRIVLGVHSIDLAGGGKILAGEDGGGVEDGSGVDGGHGQVCDDQSLIALGVSNQQGDGVAADEVLAGIVDVVQFIFHQEGAVLGGSHDLVAVTCGQGTGGADVLLGGDGDLLIIDHGVVCHQNGYLLLGAVDVGDGDGGSAVGNGGDQTVFVHGHNVVVAVGDGDFLDGGVGGNVGQLQLGGLTGLQNDRLGSDLDAGGLHIAPDLSVVDPHIALGVVVQGLDLDGLEGGGQVNDVLVVSPVLGGCHGHGLGDVAAADGGIVDTDGQSVADEVFGLDPLADLHGLTPQVLQVLGNGEGLMDGTAGIGACGDVAQMQGGVAFVEGLTVGNGVQAAGGSPQVPAGRETGQGGLVAAVLDQGVNGIALGQSHVVAGLDDLGIAEVGGAGALEDVLLQLDAGHIHTANGFGNFKFQGDGGPVGGTLDLAGQEAAQLLAGSVLDVDLEHGIAAEVLGLDVAGEGVGLVQLFLGQSYGLVQDQVAAAQNSAGEDAVSDGSGVVGACVGTVSGVVVPAGNSGNVVGLVAGVDDQVAVILGLFLNHLGQGVVVDLNGHGCTAGDSGLNLDALTASEGHVKGLPAVGLAVELDGVGAAAGCIGDVADLKGTLAGADDIVITGEAVSFGCVQAGDGLVNGQTLCAAGAVGGDAQAVLVHRGVGGDGGAVPVGPAVCLAIVVAIGEFAVEQQLVGLLGIFFDDNLGQGDVIDGAGQGRTLADHDLQLDAGAGGDDFLVQGDPAVGLAGVLGDGHIGTARIVADLQGAVAGAGDLITAGQVIGAACGEAGDSLMDCQALAAAGAVGVDGDAVLTQGRGGFGDGAEVVAPAVCLAVAVAIGEGAVDHQLDRGCACSENCHGLQQHCKADEQTRQRAQEFRCFHVFVFLLVYFRRGADAPLTIL